MEKCALSDLKVVEVGHFVAAPYCGKLLADLGAQVIKIENPVGGDPARSAGPFPNDVPHPEQSGLFLYLNTNKKSVTLDLQSAAGMETLKELLREADILVEDHSPAEAVRLGLDYKSLRRINPRLIVTSITPFGQTGPYRDYKATDLILNHIGGLAFGTPWKVMDASHEPLKAAGRQAEFVAGITAANGTMLAVFSRRLNGEGQHVDVSAFEALAAFLRFDLSFYTHDPEGMFHVIVGSRVATTGFGTIGLFPCKDGWVAIGTREQYQWVAFVDMLGSQELASDPRFGDVYSRRENWSLIEPMVLEWTGQRTMLEIFQDSQARRLPVFPVNTTETALQSAQLRDRNFFVEVDHPATGKLVYPGAPYKLSGTPWRISKPAPKLGQHNEEILHHR